VPSNPNSVRLVPKDDDPYEETNELIERLGWVQSPDFSDDLFEWEVPGTDTVVRWIVDGDTGVRFFVIEGPERQRVAEQIEGSIDPLRAKDFESYLAQFHGDQGLMEGLYTVAAAAPEQCDRRVIEILERYMRDEDPLIRRVALLATAITAWPEFAAPVRRHLDDPDPAVAEAAEAALRSLTTSG
jgi:hypothetical protein